MANGTEAEARKLFKSWNGIKEGAECDKKIISAWNKRQGRSVKSKTTPWCAIAVASALIQSGVSTGTSKGSACISAGCTQQMNYYKSKKRWKSKTTKPQAGWIVYYNFKGGTSTATHCGMVTSTDYKTKGYMYVIEGNKNDKVGYRHVKYGKNVYKYVLGYGVPYYKAEKTTAEPIADDLEPITEPIITEPVAEPVVTEPIVSTEPVVTEPVAEPIVSEPVVEPTPVPAKPTKPAAKPATSGFKSYKVQVTAKSGLNVRKGPGANYGRVGTLAKGTKVTIFAKSGEWGRIGTNKWVNLNYVKKF